MKLSGQINITLQYNLELISRKEMTDFLFLTFRRYILFTCGELVMMIANSGCSVQ
jgi:hypothetical protein